MNIIFLDIDGVCSRRLRHIKTLGQLRTLCRAINIPLKEPAK